MDGSPIITPAADVAAKPLNRREQARAKTQAKVLAAARDLFSRTAYDDVTMRGLASAIDMSTGALFANWPDKAALWRAAMGCPPPVDTLERRHLLKRQEWALRLIAMGPLTDTPLADGGCIADEASVWEMQQIADWALNGFFNWDAAYLARVVNAWFGRYTAETLALGPYDEWVKSGLQDCFPGHEGPDAIMRADLLAHKQLEQQQSQQQGSRP